MEILKIEPTPSPNTMKIVLSEKRADNQSNTYTEVKTSQPDFINDLLQIKDVKSQINLTPVNIPNCSFFLDSS